MKQSIVLWTLAILVTVAAAVYQRTTGPSYPVRGTVELNGRSVPYEFERSHPGETDHIVKIRTDDATVSGFVEWKRFKSSDDWTTSAMTFQDGTLSASLPSQPPAGKIEYRVSVRDANGTQNLPAIVIRFRGDVPLPILLTHVSLMFIGLVLSTRAGLEALSKEPDLKKLISWTIVLFAVGGLLFGPIVQKYAFGAYWTGWPFGKDLTDNKTAVMVLVWVIAAVAAKKPKARARWAVLAAVVTLAVYLVPHSLIGSELDYTKLDQQRIQTLSK
jgi:hypothetical protein